MKNHLLEYVETDLDVFRLTRFETAQDTVVPTTWSAPIALVNALFEGEVDADLPSGKGLRVARTGAGNAASIDWLTPSALTDASCVALVKPTSANVRPGIVSRVGSAGGLNGYVLHVDGTNLEFLKYVAGTPTSLATLAFPVAQNDLVWLLFDTVTISGPAVLLRAKAWFGELSDEPGLFMLVHEDSSSPITSAGNVALFLSSTNPCSYVCGHFRARSLFDSETEVHRFIKSTDYSHALDAIPNLESVSISPAVLSLGEDLGQRSTVNVQFRDHRGTDGGELFNSATFWSKFRARNLWRRGSPLRVVRSSLEGDMDEDTRHFVLDSFNGPTTNGQFSLTAKDILKFADNDRAQAPRINDGFLQNTIDDNDLAFTLLPSGVGNLQYGTSGFLNLGGKEIVSFTRSGDAVTITARAQFGTTAVSHQAEDRVQECLNINGQDPAAIVNLLLTQYADVPASYIPLSEWEVEVDTYLARLYTRLIPEPLGVNRLISELIAEAGLILWEDNQAQKLRLRVLRGIPTTAFRYSPDNVMAGSINVAEQRDRLVTQAWTYYGTRNPLDSDEERNNYRNSLATINEEEETRNGSAVIRKTFGRWIPAFAEDTAQRVNDLILGRFAIPPRKVSFSVLRNSGVQEPMAGEGYQFSYYGSVDEAGDPVDIPIQVVSVNPLPDRWQVTAEEMLFKQFDPADLIDRVIVVASNTLDFNLRAVHDSIYPELTDDDVTNGVNLTVIVNTGAIVGSSSITSPAFHAGESSDWPVGFPILLQLNGRIQGKGGNGGPQSISDLGGEDGGDALYTRFALDVEYGVDADLWGGGGGGGGTIFVSQGGGGGAGFVPGSGGDNEEPDDNFPGAPGTTETGGVGGDDTGSGSPAAGNGGGPGLNGGSTTDPFLGASAGGAAGNAVDGISFLNVLSGSADVRGATIN